MSSIACVSWPEIYPSVESEGAPRKYSDMLALGLSMTLGPITSIASMSASVRALSRGLLVVGEAYLVVALEAFCHYSAVVDYGYGLALGGVEEHYCCGGKHEGYHQYGYKQGADDEALRFTRSRYSRDMIMLSADFIGQRCLRLRRRIRRCRP